jgi:hypothetical protein
LPWYDTNSINFSKIFALQLLDAFGHKSNISLVFDFMETDLEVRLRFLENFFPSNLSKENLNVYFLPKKILVFKKKKPGVNFVEVWMDSKVKGIADFLFIYLFWWDWGLNSGLQTCKAVTLLSHLQSVLLFKMGSCQLFAQAGLEPHSSQSQLPK